MRLGTSTHKCVWWKCKSVCSFTSTYVEASAGWSIACSFCCFEVYQHLAQCKRISTNSRNTTFGTMWCHSEKTNWRGIQPQLRFQTLISKLQLSPSPVKGLSSNRMCTAVSEVKYSPTNPQAYQRRKGQPKKKICVPYMCMIWNACMNATPLTEARLLSELQSPVCACMHVCVWEKSDFN